MEVSIGSALVEEAYVFVPKIVEPRHNKRLTGLFVPLFPKPRYGDGAKDFWTTLNTIQENITKGGQKDYSRRRPNGDRMPKSRAIKGIDEDLKLNKALWHMAEVLRTGGLQA